MTKTNIKIKPDFWEASNTEMRKKWLNTFLQYYIWKYHCRQKFRLNSLFCLLCRRETISYSSLSISPSPSFSSSHLPHGKVCSIPVKGQNTTTCGNPWFSRANCTVNHQLQCLQRSVNFTLSQYHPGLTPSLSCPIVTLLRGLRSAAISTLKMSVKPRSNCPPSRNTCRIV